MTTLIFITQFTTSPKKKEEISSQKFENFTLIVRYIIASCPTEK